MSSTIGIIQARMGSERLPGKILAPLAGRPALATLVSRIRHAHVDEWWLATTSDPADDVTEAWGFELGLRVFRGHPTDVLSRFLTIGAETKADWCLRVTADNPFLDAPLINSLLAARDDGEAGKGADAVRHHGGLVIDATPSPRWPADQGPVRAPRFPVGFGVELVRREALLRASVEIPKDQAYHRTHVTSWLYSAASAKVHDVPTPLAWPHRPDWRWTIDTYEDLAMARGAFRLFGEEADSIDYPAMVAQLDAHPEITALNQHIEQKQPEEG